MYTWVRLTYIFKKQKNPVHVIVVCFFKHVTWGQFSKIMKSSIDFFPSYFLLIVFFL